MQSTKSSGVHLKALDCLKYFLVSPPLVLPDVHLEVHLEVLTYSDHTEVIPTQPRSI